MKFKFKFKVNLNYKLIKHKKCNNTEIRSGLHEHVAHAMFHKSGPADSPCGL
jgi:hypothetical protein